MEPRINVSITESKLAQLIAAGHLCAADLQCLDHHAKQSLWRLCLWCCGKRSYCQRCSEVCGKRPSYPTAATDTAAVTLSHRRK